MFLLESEQALIRAGWNFARVKDFLICIQVTLGRLHLKVKNAIANLDILSCQLLNMHIVLDCSSQELVAALMLKAAFNQFDPKKVLSDLYARQEWWKSFVMGPPLPEGAEDPLDRILLALRDLGYRWKADTLYVLTRDDEYVLPLVDLGKDWQCDRTEVIDQTRTGQLLGRHPAPPPVVVYWWD